MLMKNNSKLQNCPNVLNSIKKHPQLIHAKRHKRQICYVRAGRGEGAEAGSDVARGGAVGGRKSWGQWERFGKRVAQGKAYASCAIDFAFTDGGRLRGRADQSCELRVAVTLQEFSWF